MIFSERYSVYYNTVAVILTRAAQGDAIGRELQRLVVEKAFSESVMTILPSLKSGKWQLLHADGTPVLHYTPTMPLKTLENRNQPVIQNEQGVALVFGCTPRLFSMAASGEMTPYTVMLDVLTSERYAPIWA